MATHDLRDAERLCDRVWLLEEGRVVLDRPVAGLRDDAPEVLRDWF
jgi:thiamine transport system ATP-binding protein